LTATAQIGEANRVDITPRAHTAILICLVLAYLAYAALFIARTSAVIHGERYFVLFDDSMISMRYARNLVEGQGLVWNPGGKRVEGFTNPLWVLVMAAVHLLPLGAAKLALAVSLAGVFLQLATMAVIHRIALRLSDGSRAVALLAVALAAFSFPLNFWTLEGMEVGALAFILSLAALLLLREQADGVPYAAYAVLGIGTLVRLDAALPFAVAVVFAAFSAKRGWKRPAAVGGGMLAVFLLAQMLPRYLYYGTLLPNTYFLKMTGFPVVYRLSRGAIELAGFAWHILIVPFCAPFILLFWRRDRGTVLLAALAGAQMCYSVYVGGDAWEWAIRCNRYMAIAMPLFFVLFALALASAVRRFSRGRRARMAFATLSVAALLAFNAATADDFRGWLLLSEPLHAGDNLDHVRAALLLREVTAEDARVAVVWAGIVPYFLHRQAVDLLGKCDDVIAHQPAHSVLLGLRRFSEFYPGHMKWDLDYSLGKQKPDVIVDTWGWRGQERPYINDYQYVKVKGLPVILFRKDSSKIRWDLVQERLASLPAD
jgi:hypothetical protein